MSQMAGTVEAIRTVITMRPPNLSVQMPSGTRISEPVNTGIAIRMPNWVELRSSVFLIGMPITANIIQTMKHTVNANVLTISTERACPFLVMSKTPFWIDMTLGFATLRRYPSMEQVFLEKRTMREASHLVLKN